MQTSHSAFQTRPVGGEDMAKKMSPRQDRKVLPVYLIFMYGALWEICPNTPIVHKSETKRFWIAKSACFVAARP